MLRLELLTGGSSEMGLLGLQLGELGNSEQVAVEMVVSTLAAVVYQKIIAVVVDDVVGRSAPPPQKKRSKLSGLGPWGNCLLSTRVRPKARTSLFANAGAGTRRACNDLLEGDRDRRGLKRE